MSRSATCPGILYTGLAVIWIARADTAMRGRMKAEETLRFRDFEVHPRSFQIFRSGVPVPMERRVYDLVLYLIEHRDRVVTKDELLERVWRQQSLSDSAVARCVSAARKAFEDPDCIQSVYGRGYRWAVPVSTGDAQSLIAIHPAPKTGLWGRDRELDLIDRMVHRAAGGEGGVILISGEAGIGKTRLLSAIRDEAKRSGLRTIVARCRETEGTPAYWPWPQIVRSLCDDDQRVPQVVRQLLSFADAAEGAPERMAASRVLAWEALADYVRSEARRVPTAILIDDLHQADIGSTYLLEFVSERAGDSPLLVAAAYRSRELDREPNRLACLERVVRGASPLAIELHGLSLEDTAQFLRSWGGVSSSTELNRRAHELTGGNPFFLSLVAPLIQTYGESWSARDIVRELPNTVRASIEDQLATVSEDCRSLLRVASAIGRVVPLHVVAAALHREVAATAIWLEEACFAGLTTELSDLGSTFGFVHDLVREVIYDALSLVERSNTHLAVARALESMGSAEVPERVAETAHHYAQAVPAGGAERAIEYAVRAAALELTRLAYEAAREHLVRASALMDQFQLGDARARCAVLIDLGRAELNSGNRPAAWAAFERASELARNLSDVDAMVRIALALTGSIQSAQIDLDPRLPRLLEELLARSDCGPPQVRALLLSRLIFTLAWFPDQGKRAALAEEARRLVEHVSDRRARGSVATARCVAVHQPGDLKIRLELSDEALRECDAAGDLEVKQFAHVIRMLALLEAGRLDEVRENTKAFREVVRRLRSRDIGAIGVPIAHDGLLAHIDGRLGDLERIMTVAESLALGSSDLVTLSIGDLLRTFVSMESGNLSRAMDVIRKWTQLVPDISWQCMLIVLLAKTGSATEARERLQPHVQTGFDLQPDWHWLYRMALLADACATLRHEEGAALLYDRLSVYSDRCVTIGAACIFIGSVERYLGLLADVTCRPELAHEHFEKANHIHARIGAKLMLAYSLCDHTLFLERATDLGKAERAAELRGQATALANEVGSVYLQRRLALPGTT